MIEIFKRYGNFLLEVRLLLDSDDFESAEESIDLSIKVFEAPDGRRFAEASRLEYYVLEAFEGDHTIKSDAQIWIVDTFWWDPEWPIQAKEKADIINELVVGVNNIVEKGITYVDKYYRDLGTENI